MTQTVRDRVGIYVPHGDIPDVRGFSPAIVAWNHGILMRRFEPLFICAREVADRPLSDTRPSICRLSESRLYRRVFRKWTRWDPWPLHRRAASRARGHAAVIWHAHQLEFPVSDFRRAFGRPLPVVVHAHVTAQRFRPERGLADRYLAVSGYVREQMVERLGYPAERVEILPNGVDVDLFAPAGDGEKQALRRRLGLPGDARIVLFAGRKQLVKGFDLFLSVAEALAPKFPDVYWLAVGPEPEDAAREAGFRERLQQRHRLRATGRYRELAELPQTGIADVMRLSDVLFAPSRIETQGMVMIEGLASGLLVISRAVGGILESVRAGETGFLLSPTADIEEAATLLHSVLDRLPDFESMRQAGRADVVRRFSWEGVVARLEDIYQQILERA